MKLILRVRFWSRIIISLFWITCFGLVAQDTTSVSLLFLGDLMMHEKQIISAQYGEQYDFNPCFQYFREEFYSADWVIGNLECTSSGRPYSGYPNFRAPDELAEALIKAGVNCLVTANNHALDGGRNGLNRTILILDSLQIAQTGTFRDSVDRNERTPLILDRKNIRIAILNYTYGTNYSLSEDSGVVNHICKTQIDSDVRKAHRLNVDLIVVFFHWGREYESVPRESEIDLARYCHEQGIDIVIGSHPHVLQRIETEVDSTKTINQLTAYSLGNFISDYVTPERIGSAVLKIVLEKQGDALVVIEAGYLLTWVVRMTQAGRQRYFVVPADHLDSIENLKLTIDQRKRLQRFLKHARELLKSGDGYLPEYRWDAKRKNWYLP